MTAQGHSNPLSKAFAIEEGLNSLKHDARTLGLLSLPGAQGGLHAQEFIMTENERVAHPLTAYKTPAGLPILENGAPTFRQSLRLRFPYPVDPIAEITQVQLSIIVDQRATSAIVSGLEEHILQRVKAIAGPDIMSNLISRDADIIHTAPQIVKHFKAISFTSSDVQP